MDEYQRPDREGAQYKDDNQREREVHGGDVGDARRRENSANPPHAEYQRPRVDHEVVERPEEHRVRRGGGDEDDEHDSEDAQIRWALKRHCEGLGIFERIVAGVQALEVDRERPRHDISG
jgi:hypothetical protein